VLHSALGFSIVIIAGQFTIREKFTIYVNWQSCRLDGAP